MHANNNATTYQQYVGMGARKGVEKRVGKIWESTFCPVPILLVTLIAIFLTNSKLEQTQN